MRAFGIIAGIMMSIMGGYAFFLDMEIFVRLGWMLGVVFILNSLVLLLPTIQEKRAAKLKAKELANQPEAPLSRKKTKQEKKRQHEAELQKKSNINPVLGGISLVVGILIFISGAAKTLTGMALVYVVGSCVMFYGWLQIYNITKTPKKEEQDRTIRKKKKAPQIDEDKKKDKKTIMICGVISLLLGGLAVCNTFIESFSVDRLVAYNLVMQGVNGVLIATITYPKKQKQNK